MVPPFRNPSIPPAVINPLFISSSICPPEVRKALLVGDWITPLLVIVALVAFGVDTAPVELVLISIPELIVTLEPFPLIFKSEQFVVIITVVPETAVQSRASACLDANTENPSAEIARDAVIIACLFECIGR